MKRASSSKLSLHRETLVTLSPDALDRVNGGTGTIPRLITRYVCPQITLLNQCTTRPQAGGK